MGYALEMRSPGTKSTDDLRVTSETGYLRYVGSKGLTLTDDATVTITKSSDAYYTGRLGTIDFRGHALTLTHVKNFPELTFDVLRPVNPGNLIFKDNVNLALTSLHEDFRSLADRLRGTRGARWYAALRRRSDPRVDRPARRDERCAWND